MPEDGYGWEKLFSRADVPPLPRRLRPRTPASPASTTSTARFGTWDGGREKAPAAICRKVIHAKETGDHDIEIWGDGKQTRSFMYIDDCTSRFDLQTESVQLLQELLVAQLGGVRTRGPTNHRPRDRTTPAGVTPVGAEPRREHRIRSASRAAGGPDRPRTPLAAPMSGTESSAESHAC